MLADVARHVANAYEQNERGDYFEVLTRIRQIFDAECRPPDTSPQNLIKTNL